MLLSWVWNTHKNERMQTRASGQIQIPSHFAQILADLPSSFLADTSHSKTTFLFDKIDPDGGIAFVRQTEHALSPVKHEDWWFLEDRRYGRNWCSMTDKDPFTSIQQEQIYIVRQQWQYDSAKWYLRNSRTTVERLGRMSNATGTQIWCRGLETVIDSITAS